MSSKALLEQDRPDVCLANNYGTVGTNVAVVELCAAKYSYIPDRALQGMMQLP